MSDEETIEAYANLYLESLTDEVQFARRILHFQPYPYQEEFLRDRSPFIAACCGRQVGKTTVAAIKALHFALAKKDKHVLIVSAGLRQSMILFNRILGYVEKAIPVRALLVGGNRTEVKFANDSGIIALPCGREGSTLRGHTADMAILDEANFMPRIVIESVIRPTTITRSDPRIIMLSTPWMKDHPFYEAVTKPELGFRTYNWPTSVNPQITKQKLDLERKTIGEFAYNREYEATFMDDESAYFPSTLILSCTDDYNLNPEPKTGETWKGEFYVGIDFGKHRDHSAIAIIQEQQKHSLRLVYLREFQLETPYATVIGNVRTLNDAYQFRGGRLDQTGVGEAPHEEIKQFAPVIKGITLTTQTKQDILGKLRLTMEHGDITIPLEPRTLLTQLTQQRCEPTQSGNLKFSHPQGTHDDLAWAFALAVHAYRGPLDWMTMAIGV
ncbi:MAG TPA: terminase family protein, partial [Candidatus Acidoferrales bacterium]|nr:terminase family protein [Candidatus Acidoferrales bacterium]